MQQRSGELVNLTVDSGAVRSCLQENVAKGHQMRKVENQDSFLILFSDSRIISNDLLGSSNTCLTLSSVVLVVVRAVTNRIIFNVFEF